jgi:large conductance mechanosensitive channel
MGLLKEFKEFAMKGSVVDLAVGVVIGGAFGGVVQSLVKDVIMPPIGLITGGVDFTDKQFTLKHPIMDATGKTVLTPGVYLHYGAFINAIINFLIISASIFLVIKLMNTARRKHDDAPPPPSTKPCPFCTSAIPIGAKKCPLCTADLPAMA